MTVTVRFTVPRVGQPLARGGSRVRTVWYSPRTGLHGVLLRDGARLSVAVRPDARTDRDSAVRFGWAGEMPDAVATGIVPRGVVTRPAPRGLRGALTAVSASRFVRALRMGAVVGSVVHTASHVAPVIPALFV